MVTVIIKVTEGGEGLIFARVIDAFAPVRQSFIGGSMAHSAKLLGG